MSFKSFYDFLSRKISAFQMEIATPPETVPPEEAGVLTQDPHFKRRRR